MHSLFFALPYLSNRLSKKNSEKNSDSNSEEPEAPEPVNDVLGAWEKIGDTDEELLQALADVPDGKVDIIGSALSLTLGKRSSENMGLGSAFKKLKFKSDNSSDEENFDFFEEVPILGVPSNLIHRDNAVRSAFSVNNTWHVFIWIYSFYIESKIF